jgi:hypothetical protein
VAVCILHAVVVVIVDDVVAIFAIVSRFECVLSAELNFVFQL